MVEIFVGLLVIFLINGQVQTAEDTKEYFPLSFANIQSVYNWGQKLYQVNTELTNVYTPRNHIDSLFNEKNQLERELLNLRTPKIPVTNLTNMYGYGFFVVGNHDVTNATFEILPPTFIDEINKMFRELMYIKHSQENAGESQDVLTKVLSYEPKLQDLLNKIENRITYDTRPTIGSHILYNVMPSILGQIGLLKHNASFCYLGNSIQQGTYYVYVSLIYAEMQGFAALQRIYTLMQINGQNFDDGNGQTFGSASVAAMDNFVRRLKLYNKKFTQLMSLVSQQRFNCLIEEKQMKTDVNYLEVKSFSRIMIRDLLRRTAVCDKDVSNYCESYIEKYPHHQFHTMYNCKDIMGPIKSCDAKRGTSRIYLWFEDTNSNVHYGSQQTCSKPLTVHRRIAKSDGDNCPFCVCSEDSDKHNINSHPQVSGISIGEEISDISNNMVVTGIKFITFDNAIHLQIQQAKFFDDALQLNGRAEWKKVFGNRYNKNGRKIRGKYEPLQHKRKSIYLDDIKVPDGYVVTGVRFMPVHDGFMLQVHGTLFDIESAKLDGSTNEWFNATTHPMKPECYQRSRIVVKIDGRTLDEEFNPYRADPESNKLVQFTHSDINEDAGQTTIPLLDSRPVEPEIPIPLSGVGLFYRKKQNFGGYLTPSIYTMDVTPYIKMDVVNKDRIEK